MKLDLIRTLTNWEVQRVTRVKLENIFKDITSWIDAIELHIPYTHYEYAEEMMDETIKRKGVGKKILLSLGDSINLDMFSVFYQTSQDRSKPSDEIDNLIHFLKKANGIYDKIIFLESNHEARLGKILLHSLKSREQSEELFKNMITLEERFKKAQLDKVIYVRHYLFQMGDIVFTHLENNSGTIGSVPIWLLRWLTPRVKRKFNVVMQAHTHYQSFNPVDRKLIIETGCLAPTLDYWRKGKMTGKNKMGSIGYAVGQLRDGEAILNSCRPIIKAWEGYV